MQVRLNLKRKEFVEHENIFTLMKGQVNTEVKSQKKDVFDHGKRKT